MSDLLRELLGVGAIPETSFPPNSRYAGVEVRVHQPPGEANPVPYLARRLCPQPHRYATLYEIPIDNGDRKDKLAAEHIGDAELWWRLADANGVIDPRELTDTPGSRIRVTLEADVPGGQDD